MLFDRRPNIFIHTLHRATGKIGLGIKQRKRAFFLGQINRRQIGGASDSVQPSIGLRHCSRRSIAQPHHQQRVGQTGHTQPDTPLVAGLLRLRLKRKFRRHDHIVQHPHRDRHQIGQSALFDCGTGFKRRVNQT